nr:FixH family protein [uncultured Roseateles sp.]
MLYRSPSLLLAAAALVLTAGCSTPPADLDLSLQHPSANGKFIVALQPPAKPAAINQLHAWQIRLTTAEGAPVHGARFAVDGGMPQHGHGLPTRPQVTLQLPDGSYLLEGMKFSMSGWWEIKLSIQAAEGADKVSFNTVVAQPKAGL